MIKKQLLVNYITNNVFSSRTYWLSEIQQSKIWLVDCEDVEEVVKDTSEDTMIAGVLLTHVHFDHIYGLNKLLSLFPNCVVYTNDFGQKSLTDPRRIFSRYHTDIDDFIFEYPGKVVVVRDGERIELFEGVYADVYYTPGHDESSWTYRI